MEYDRHAPKQNVKLATETNHADRLFFFFSHSSPKLLACEAWTNRPYMANVYADIPPNAVITINAGTKLDR
jgi:hypothetical protein